MYGMENAMLSYVAVVINISQYISGIYETAIQILAVL